MDDVTDSTAISLPPGFTGPTDNPWPNKPSYWGQRKRLCSRTGYNLCISSTGKVYGSNTDTDPNANLILESRSPGIVSIKGEVSGLYLSFNPKGRPEGMKELGDECLLEERILPTNYSVYASHKYSEKKWFIGINKRGKVRNGKRTKIEKKSSQFVPRCALEVA